MYVFNIEFSDLLLACKTIGLDSQPEKLFKRLCIRKSPISLSEDSRFTLSGVLLYSSFLRSVCAS